MGFCDHFRVCGWSRGFISLSLLSSSPVRVVRGSPPPVGRGNTEYFRWTALEGRGFGFSHKRSCVLFKSCQFVMKGSSSSSFFNKKGRGGGQPGIRTCLCVDSQFFNYLILSFIFTVTAIKQSFVEFTFLIRPFYLLILNIRSIDPYQMP